MPEDIFSAPAAEPICIVARGLAGANLLPDEPAAVLLHGGRVELVGAKALGTGAPRFDLPELWLSPAPLDAHVHMLMRATLEQSLDGFRRAGVAAVRDLGNRPVDATPAAEPGQPPLIVASGPGLSCQGPGSCWLAHKLATPEQFAERARQRVAEGADLIKVFVSGLLSFDQPGVVEHPDAVDERCLRAAVEVADAAGLPVAVHASGLEAVNRAVRCGVRSVEHGFFLDEATWRAMAHKGISWVPTVAPIVTHAEDPDGRHDPAGKDRLMAIARRQMEDLPKAHALGVDLVLGTDAGSYGLPHHQAVRREMELWLRAGLPPEVVFDAATKRAAVLLGLEGRVGAIVPGAMAWLLGTEEDPRRDPLLLTQPAWRSF